MSLFSIRNKNGKNRCDSLFFQFFCQLNPSDVIFNFFVKNHLCLTCIFVKIRYEIINRKIYLSLKNNSFFKKIFSKLNKAIVTITSLILLPGSKCYLIRPNFTESYMCHIKTENIQFYVCCQSVMTICCRHWLELHTCA